MAKSKQDSPETRKPRGPSRIRRWITILVIMVSIIVGLPTAIVIAVGMLPTLVSFIVDMTPGRYACRCVAGLNVAGVAPFVDKLWSGHNDVNAAMNIIGDTLAWLAFYGSAGFGWILFMSLPGLVATSQTLNARRVVHNLHARQEEIAKEWGLNVKTNKPDADNSGPVDDDIGPEQSDEEFAAL
ncbi:MAG: hypothetical protein HQ514_14425 [Rhodospirillales bacterium]|nr:hypothetical protein [Rhodospirillales bacterium]